MLCKEKDTKTSCNGLYSSSSFTKLSRSRMALKRWMRTERLLLLLLLLLLFHHIVAALQVWVNHLDLQSTLRNPLKASLSGDEMWWSPSIMITFGRSDAFCSHLSVTLDKYGRSSRPDLLSTLNVAIESSSSFQPDLHTNTDKVLYTRYRVLGTQLIPVYRQSDRRSLIPQPHAAIITFWQACGHLPSRRTSPSFDRYQVILLGERGTQVWTTCPRLLHSFVPVTTEPMTYWSQVQRLIATSFRQMNQQNQLHCSFNLLFSSSINLSH